jgi:hypothetical protein
MTYEDFDRKYLICPEETLAIYGLLKDIDDYIDLKLGILLLNIYQQNQTTIVKNKFIDSYLKINGNPFKSKELLNQHNDEKEEPISLDLGLLKIKNTLLKNENRICFPGKGKEGIRNRETIKENSTRNGFIREVHRNKEDEEFIFSDDEWVLEDNGQQHLP